MTTQPTTRHAPYSILGIDAGTHKAGLAIITADGVLIWSRQLRLVGSSEGERLTHLRQSVQQTIATYKPVRVAVEAAIRYRSPEHRGGSSSVGHGTPIILQLVHEMGLPDALEVFPSQAKLALAGAGNADKEAMQDAAMRRFGLAAVGEDESDALGVALHAVGLLWRAAAVGVVPGAGKRRAGR